MYLSYKIYFACFAFFLIFFWNHFPPLSISRLHNMNINNLVYLLVICACFTRSRKKEDAADHPFYLLFHSFFGKLKYTVFFDLSLTRARYFFLGRKMEALF